MSLASLPLLVSKYRLMEEIGHGGMATVYRAEDTRLGREVALKLLHRHLRNSHEIQTRFTSEARAIAKLRHPNIVEVFDVSDEDELEGYLVMELVRGGTLRELMTRVGPLPVELAALIVCELADALAHAHAQGVIHRDIKPENVLVESSHAEATHRQSRPDFRPPADDGGDKAGPLARVKLTDFGIAKLLDAQGVTSTGQVLGSPAHMAPEQIEGRSVDVRADVFSLAGLFYEAVVGALPFAGTNPAQVLRNVLDGRSRAPELVRPEIGATWSRLIMRGLARAPEDRFATVALFADAIRKELAEVEFLDTEAEFGAYLAEPAAYQAQFVERLVPALARSAEKARVAGDLQRSTSQLSRALSYRPGDPALLRQSRQVQRRLRLRSVLAYGAIAVGLGLCVGFGARVWTQGALPAKPAGGAALSPVKVATGGPMPSSAASASAPVAPVPTARVRKAAPAETLRHRPAAPRVSVASPVSSAPTADATRRVAIRVTGAVGGGVRVDGKTVQWFGVEHELSVGTHVFEFVAPNETCCLGTRRVVRIEPGEGPQLVTGKIPFKDAVLRVSSAASQGFELSCPTLFGGSMRLPDDKSVPMSQVAATGTCTVVNSKLGATPTSKVITLRAGTATLLPWP